MVLVFFDALFVVSSDRSFQSGISQKVRYNDDGLANIMNYAPSKSKQLCESVLAGD